MSYYHLATTVSLFLCLSAGTCNRTPVALSEDRAAVIRDSVRATLDSYNRHYTAREWDSVIRFYADDARFAWVEDGVVRYRSTAEIRQALESLPPSMRVETTYGDMDISVLSADVATVVTAFETRFVDAAGAEFGFGGMITMTLVREQNGWRIFGGHTSSAKRRGQ